MFNSFEEYAKQNYLYRGCFIYCEFKSDLRNISTVSKMIKELVSGSVYDIKRVVNLLICVSNVFTRDAIPTLLSHKLDEYYWPIANSFLICVNLPCINTEFIPTLVEHIQGEYRNEII
jgi:hypothetical protein